MVSREKIWRMGIYLSGMMLLALGITLTTLSGQGASAIVSVPYTISRGTGLKFADLTLLFYCSFVAVQFVIKGKKQKLGRHFAGACEHHFHPVYGAVSEFDPLPQRLAAYGSDGAGAGNPADGGWCIHDGGYDAGAEPRGWHRAQHFHTDGEGAGAVQELL